MTLPPFYFKGVSDDGLYAYFSKFIELVNKTELKVFESTKIELINFEKIKENKNVLPKYIEEFTSNFWEEF